MAYLRGEEQDKKMVAPKGRRETGMPLFWPSCALCAYGGGGRSKIILMENQKPRHGWITRHGPGREQNFDSAPQKA
jgi:hypothetical protein